MTRRRRLALVAALAAGLTLFPVGARADLDDDLAAVRGEIADLEHRLESVSAERSQLVASILSTRDRLEIAAAALDEAEAALTEVRVSIVATEFELAATENGLQASRDTMAALRRDIQSGTAAAREWARERYIHGAGGDLAPVLLTTERVTDLGSAMYILERYNARATAAIDRLEALGREEERQQARIEEQQRRLQAIREELATAETRQIGLAEERRDRAAEVRGELATQGGLLAELDAIIEEFETDIDGLAVEQDRLEALLAGSTSSGGTSPGILVRPVPGPITSPFGPRMHPILGYTRLHAGVDMTAPQGQAIVAGAAGRVILAGGYGGYGLTVIVDHGGGMATLYAHQSRLAVSTGDWVTAGEVVGYAGSTGLATGPHLHFEVRINGTPVDPADYF